MMSALSVIVMKKITNKICPDIIVGAGIGLVLGNLIGLTICITILN